jgi:hypothetical protein
VTTPYRNDIEALTARLAALSEELGAVRSRTRELSDLQQTEAKLELEISGLTRELHGMMRRRALPMLEDVRVASPCTADWGTMIGDGRVRFCGECQKHVYNLSGMSREEAEALVRGTSNDICIRFHRRADGRVLTSDCSVGARRARRRKVVLATIGGGFLAAGAVLTARAATSHDDVLPEAASEDGSTMMGLMK